ncbi:MRN complex-interacting protein-like isoform X2 [Triticum dicoccoides]|uniref:MRN complex-interacting protein-like isoform X2 n=1 Tax=Triticum dicoccoides TaxID=85692 RepID=UPI00188DD23A|nr:MRN complex-interacting protein-like isoform X2 [Triticum dicoccoides]
MYQVKQQKKSSNKWACVVCNRRQSVLRVHARGYRAADLRRFVQDANLARGRGAPVREADWDPPVAGDQQDEPPREKKRMDWSEYLDDTGERHAGRGFADSRDDGIEVTTELPQERPKAPSLKRPRKAQLGVAGKRPKPPINPSLSKMQQMEQGPTCSTVCSATSTAEAQRSKFSKYLDSSFFEDRNQEGSGLHWTDLDESAPTTEVVVDDECICSTSYYAPTFILGVSDTSMLLRYSYLQISVGLGIGIITRNVLFHV